MTTIKYYLRILPFLFFIFLGFSRASWAENAAVDAPQVVVVGDEPEPFLDHEVKVKAPPVTSRLHGSHAIVQTMPERMMGLIGLALILVLAFLFSTNRKAIPWRLVILGTVLQAVLAVIVLKTQLGRIMFDGANNFIVKILSFSNEGARFVFGNLVDLNVPIGIPKGAYGPMSDLTLTGAFANTGAFFAFSVMPTIVFFSAVTAILYYFGILPFIIRGIARVMQTTLRCSGAESFSASANIFVGQTEAPLLIKPFLANMTRSEIMAIMTGGFATVSGGVLAAFVGMLVSEFPDIAGHLIAASVMSAPASLVLAKMMLPETETPKTMSAKDINVENTDSNMFDAATRGTSEGMHLALNVAAMLIAFVAIIAFSNWILGGIGSLFGFQGLSLDQIFATLFAPFAYLLGVPWEDAAAVGNLLGLKTAVNEFVSYLQLSEYLQSDFIKHDKSVVIAVYALCGFANFASIGVQIGGLSAMAPSRRQDFARIGLRAMVAGTLASLQTAAIAGMLL
jgi:CNT family concentrative nucleoside transporter